MARPRKIQNQIPLDSDEDVSVTAEKIVESLSKRNDEGPFWVIDPRSRVVKRLWTQEELSLHLARGWMRNG